MVGILARLPQALFKSLQQELPIIMVDRCWLLKYHLVISYHLLCTGFVSGKFRVNMHVVTTSGDFEQDMLGGNRQWIPLKLNAWVMPIIFAQAIILFQLP
jgi:preprotein translocase subunit SecY